ncbi:unnamed protein product [Ectocarpus sp. 12 AP-2014]
MGSSQKQGGLLVFFVLHVLERVLLGAVNRLGFPNLLSSVFGAVGIQSTGSRAPRRRQLDCVHVGHIAQHCAQERM